MKYLNLLMDYFTESKIAFLEKVVNGFKQVQGIKFLLIVRTRRNKTVFKETFKVFEPQSFFANIKNDKKWGVNKLSDMIQEVSPAVTYLGDDATAEFKVLCLVNFKLTGQKEMKTWGKKFDNTQIVEIVKENNEYRRG